MENYIIIGAIIGSIIGLVTVIPVVITIRRGAFIKGLFSRQLNKNTLQTNDIKNKHTLELKEEQLDIKKERVKIGEVKIRKEVVEDLKTITVPIKREEMVIEAGSEEEFRIPLKEEEIEISKHPVQLADVSVTKKQIEHIEEITKKLKKEVPSVEVKGDVDVTEETK
ncbi:YsnF/AvaK domain-containing protein [Anaerobacillus alkaliphilus]|uniref:YsnF/AvaK domain-containing protein n=1 Tax=Anaerobacillus alkaliphilus TaxID=1548597 RepID=A0A4Q0VXB5_9BACI|nr:YsnF/AvaK domain-containing protein [Anaerobacillus alkaliphilus]RXJ03074.1 YsnF/AvaK domain-containing protein [Anaerobacillus alkaliphilus]